MLSASAADEIEDDEDALSTTAMTDEGGSEDVATGTFAKPVDSTGFSGLLNARRSPPMGSPFGRDGFGSARLPTPSPGYAVAVSTAPAPATSPFSARLSPVPAGSPYGARATQSSMPAIRDPGAVGRARDHGRDRAVQPRAGAGLCARGERDRVLRPRVRDQGDGRAQPAHADDRRDQAGAGAAGAACRRPGAAAAPGGGTAPAHAGGAETTAPKTAVRRTDPAAAHHRAGGCRPRVRSRRWSR